MNIMETINIYTDGATPNNRFSKTNNVIGGIGVFIMFNDGTNKSFSEKITNATNNKCELLAIKKALECVKILKLQNKNVIIHSDSMYSINCCTKWNKNWENNGWKTSKGKPVENKQIIQDIILKLEESKNVVIVHVKGHSGNIGNEMADKLATSACKS